FIPAGIAQPLRFRIEHCVQRLLNAAAHSSPQVVLHPLVINVDDLTQLFRAILIHGGFLVRPLIRFATTSLAEPRGHRPSLKFAKDSVRHRKSGRAFAETNTAAPVRGLSPLRALRRFTKNAPKPRSSYTVSLSETPGDLLKDGIDDPLDVSLVEM